MDWRSLGEMARATPPGRDRYVDFLRVAAIFFVVTGHWLAPVITVDAAGIRLGHLTGIASWAVWMSWVFQVMPVFFFVGGYANSVSWDSAGRRGTGYAAWVGGRLGRMLIPVLPLILFWSAAGLVAHLAGTGSAMVSEASRLALIPVWFLAVYVVVTLVTPLTLAFFHRFGLASFWTFFALAVFTDVFVLIVQDMTARWLNYGFVWLAAHQLGHAWRAGSLGPARIRLGLALAGAAGLLVFIGFLDYPVAMVSVPGEAVSNSRPPSFVLLALGMVQIGVLTSVAGPIRRALRGESLWAAVIAGNRIIMTVFLWHMTTFLLCIGAAWALGGIGLRLAPGSGEWWWARLPWFAVFILALGGAVALMGRFEDIRARHRAARASRRSRLRGPCRRAWGWSSSRSTGWRRIRASASVSSRSRRCSRGCFWS